MALSYTPIEQGPKRSPALLGVDLEQKPMANPFFNPRTDIDNQLHPDQRRFKNLTNADVRLLMKNGLLPARFLVNESLLVLGKMKGMSRADQEARWNELPTHCFFGKWTRARFGRIFSRYKRIQRLLYSPTLRFFKNPELHKMGEAWPTIRQIQLPGKYFSNKWFAAGHTKIDQASTIVHETSHVIGVFSGKEKKLYGRENIVKEAQKTPISAEMLSDAYEFLAVDLALKRFSPPSAADHCQLAMTIPDDCDAPW